MWSLNTYLVNYMSAYFLITTIEEQGILALVLYGDLVINSKELLDGPFKKTINNKWDGYHETVWIPGIKSNHGL